MAQQRAVLGDLVGPDATQRRRVRVQGECGTVSCVAHAVYRRPGDRDALPSPDGDAHGPAEGEPLLAYGSGHDAGHRRAVVVVVEPGVMARIQETA